MKEKLPRFLRKRCAPSQWMGMRTLEERVSQRCPDLQRNRERGKSQSCGPCALMARQRTLSRTSPCRQPPKSLHCQNHRPRTKANGKFYLKPRQLPFSSSVDRKNLRSRSALGCSQDAPCGRRKCRHCICCFTDDTSPVVSPGPAKKMEEKDLIVHQSPNG